MINSARDAAFASTYVPKTFFLKEKGAAGGATGCPVWTAKKNALAVFFAK
jgi:hypothetical protein